MSDYLNKVISDITGVTGMAIIRAIVAGERNPQVLAELKNSRMTGSAKLGGNWELEEKIGNVKSPLGFESDAMENYASVLGTYSVTNTRNYSCFKRSFC